MQCSRSLRRLCDKCVVYVSVRMWCLQRVWRFTSKDLLFVFKNTHTDTKMSNSSLQDASTRTWQDWGNVSFWMWGFLSCQETVTSQADVCLLIHHTSCHLFTEPNPCAYIMLGNPIDASPEVILLILIILSICFEYHILLIL